MQGSIVADIQIHCSGPVCYNRPYPIRHTVRSSRDGHWWTVECSRCFTSREASQSEVTLAANRVEELALVNQGQDIGYTATASL